MVHDLFAETVFGDSPLGRPVLGTVESIEAMTAGHRRLLPPALPTGALVVAAAGNVDHATVVRLVRRGLRPAGALARRTSGGAGRTARRWQEPARAAAASVVSRPTEQAHLVLGGWGAGPHRRAPLRARRAQQRARRRHVVAAVPGGPREARAWPTRSTRTPRSTPTPACSASTPAACRRRSTRSWTSAATELATVADGGITEEELARGKGDAQGLARARLEDTGSRMSRLGKSELVYGELLSVDEILARIDAVTLDDVRAGGPRRSPTGAPSLAVIGPFAHDQLRRRRRDDRRRRRSPRPLGARVAAPARRWRPRPIRVGSWRRGGWAPRCAARRCRRGLTWSPWSGPGPAVAAGRLADAAPRWWSTSPSRMP